ncbi:MAG: Uma2 family endonuclease [Isosphaeraceae bacterium]|nr:Uma2 family endonuclease [Isosphaeraceae bacterium]
MSTAEVKSQQRIGLGSAGIRMMPEEFDALWHADPRYRYELIRGVLIVSRLPLVGETDPNEELGRLLRNYQVDHPQGSVLDKTLPERYVYLPDSRRRADRLIWAGLGRVPDIEADTPTIVVEFVSKGKRDWIRDYEEKRREYLAVGIQEYWVIDRFRWTMTVYRKPPAEPAEVVVPAEGTYATPLLPGFELPLARLLRIADDWTRRRQRSARAAISIWG